MLNYSTKKSAKNLQFSKQNNFSVCLSEIIFILTFAANSLSKMNKATADNVYKASANCISFSEASVCTFPAL